MSECGSSAGFGRRFAALVYDGIVILAPLIFFTWGAVWLAHGKPMLRDSVGGLRANSYRAGLFAIVAGYFVLNWVHSGQTVGMRAWRLHAVDLRGRRMTPRAALARFFWSLLAWAPAGLGVLWLYFDPERLALQDRLSDTRIVHLARA
ncbi:MAG TPA: RDD family protein [Steroidobacteraceae bacterium]|nr:RDD family protein [Steroidobacteraceae bacterium]